ncbi:MAG: heavy metal sensor histidine kinase [Sulfurimicrobium sp.]|nr:heavy metal sensor histidine kinase [Sulfurimicrobium sp.]
MKPGSLTLRLSILFALTTVVLLAGIGAYLYRFLDIELMQRDHAELAGKVELFRHQLATVNSLSQIVATPNEFRDVIIGHPHLRLALLDEAGNVLLATADWRPGAEMLKMPVAADDAPHGAAIQMPTPGDPYHTVAAWGALGGGTGERALIVLSLDSREALELLANYRRALFAAMLFGGLAAAILGFLTARNSLRPLRQMAETASDISASRLERRLEVAHAPRELKALAAAFNAMLERLRDSFSRLSDFSSDLAHELRTPINNLMGQTQVALSRTRGAGEYRAVLESNLEEYERLARMIGDMLFLAKADNAQAPLNAEEIDLRAELDKVAEFHEVLADEAGLKIICEGEGRVAADHILAQRAIANLLSNAIRHTPPGGVIRAAIAATGEAVALCVSNPGPGISPEHLERVFDRFYQVDGARERSDAGTGLGLAIVKSIMRLHGGDARVASEPGRITTFTLQFPGPVAAKSLIPA